MAVLFGVAESDFTVLEVVDVEAALSGAGWLPPQPVSPRHAASATDATIDIAFLFVTMIPFLGDFTMFVAL